MKLKPVSVLQVGLSLAGKTYKVGRLAYRDRRAFFEYHPGFLASGLEISPLKLPLAAGVKAGPVDLNEGLHGVFNDSLPDGWGRLLLDRHLRQRGIEPEQLTPLDRLAHVGSHGMGALVYEPDHAEAPPAGELDLDHLAQTSAQVIKGETKAALNELIALNGSSAGARPKAMIAVSQDRLSILHGIDDNPPGYTRWLVKFGNVGDRADAGAVEYAYSRMAQDAGLMPPPTHLFPAKKGPGYFGVQRFDITDDGRLHMHTAAGLLHADFRLPGLDYKDLLDLTLHLTRDQREVLKMYRLAVFNVLARNRDDHPKNFSFLMDGSGKWICAPPYDLTYASGPGGEQSTMVLGEGKAPGRQHLLLLAKAVGIAMPAATAILAQVEAAIAKWPLYAREANVGSATLNRIRKALAA